MFPSITVSRNTGREDVACIHDFQRQIHGIAELLFTNILVRDLFCLCLFYLPLLNESLFINCFLPHSSNKMCLSFFLWETGCFFFCSRGNTFPQINLNVFLCQENFIKIMWFSVSEGLLSLFNFPFSHFFLNFHTSIKNKMKQSFPLKLSVARFLLSLLLCLPLSLLWP